MFNLCNTSFKWTERENRIFVNGYIYYKDKYLEGQDLIDYFDGDIIYLNSKLKKANGFFSAIIKVNDIVYLCSDKKRTLPIFYNYKENIIVTDRINFKNEKQINSLNLKSIAEFKTTGFVSGSNTLLKNWNQIEAGQVVRICPNEGVSKEYYYEYIVRSKEETQKGNDEDLKNILKKVISRIIPVVGNNQIALPLSGGYDSRLIAVLLKDLGLTNVMCYTYGKQNSSEVIVSKKVADKLGFKWCFVEYSDDLITGISKDKDFIDFFFGIGSNASSIPHIQDYLAIKKLKEDGYIKSDAYFIPGHSGDFLAGSHLNNDWRDSSQREESIKAIINKHYRLKPIENGNELYATINASLGKGLAYSLFENWGLRERQSKYIINSIRAYEYFGYNYLIPLWDDELVEYFRKLKLRDKKETYLYNYTIFKHFFERYEVGFLKSKLSFSRKLVIKYFPKNVKAILKKYMSFYKGIDDNNFAKLSQEFGSFEGNMIASVLTEYYLSKNEA